MESESNIKTLNDTRFKLPRMYAVTLYNDNITTMDFVVEVLVKIFHKTTADASVIMMQVHETGKGVAGIYTYDIAVTKKMQADRMATEKGFPLRLSVE
jgi:ATP-dependent Clp protease adaptor protein ClpS